MNPKRAQSFAHLRPKFKPPLEKEEQKLVISLLKLTGWRVYSTSQYRASHVAVGFPDLYATHEGIKTALWWETKKYQAKGYDPRKPATWIPEPLRPEQDEFRLRMERAGQHYGWGGAEELKRVLVRFGVGYFERGAFVLRPQGGNA